MDRTPQELTVSCILKAVNAQEAGAIGGYYARTNPQKDPANLMPQTLYFSAERPSPSDPNNSKVVFSERLTNVAQAHGGLHLPVNNQLGAPMATFAYGGITPGSAHPQLTLCQGPATSQSFTLGSETFTVTYNPVFSSSASFGTALGAGNIDAPVTVSGNNNTPPNPVPQFPTIPAAPNSLFPNAPIETTYNIWQMNNIIGNTQGGVQYTQNFGPQFPTGYTGPRYRMVPSQDNTCAILVNAQNTVCQMFRVFPIACDMAFGAKLFYPPLSVRGAVVTSTSVGNRIIEAVGGENCGFQLHFYHSKISNTTNANTGQIQGTINIQFGDFANTYISAQPQTGNTSVQANSYISKFSLVLSPGSGPILYFFNPQTNEWQKFPLNGPTFGDGEYHIYVHFAGPDMLVGFDTDPSGWNAFVPFSDYSDYSKYYFPRIPATSTISVAFTNITATFQYGPIAFNNYHPENIISTVDFANKLDRGFISVNFTAPTTKASSALNASTISENFQSHAFQAPDINPVAKFLTGPTYYPDWRSPANNPGLVYVQQPGAVANTNGVDSMVSGVVFYNTTIEGPLFHHIRNFQNKSYASALDLLQPLNWGQPYGSDVSTYFSDAQIDYTFENSNRSRLVGKAAITLKNLGTTDEGRNVLTLLTENKIAVTLAAGYGNNLNTFFEGILEHTNASYNADGSTTHTLQFVDVSTQILGDQHFQNTLSFMNCTYGYIVGTAIRMSGLADWYVQQFSDKVNFANGQNLNNIPTGTVLSSDANYTFLDALNFSLGIMPLETSLANKILFASPAKVILDILDGCLDVIIGSSSTNPGLTPQIPILWWSPSSATSPGTLNLDWRNDPNKLDTLYFVGLPGSDGNVLLPNSRTDGYTLHGVLKTSYTEDSFINQLHSGVIVAGMSWINELLSSPVSDPTAFSSEALALIQNAMGGANGLAPIQGYEGYRADIIDYTHSMYFPDQVSMTNYANQVFARIRQVYKTTKFSCYVEIPLNHQAQFNILSFNSQSATDAYFYASASYKIDKNENTIVADITGENFPSLVLKNTNTPLIR